MELTRSSFPFDTFTIPKGVNSASFAENCVWNLKIEMEGECTGIYDVAPIYVYAKFLPEIFNPTLIEDPDGYGKNIDILKKVDRVFVFEFMSNTYINKYIYEMIYSSKELKLTTNEDTPISLVIKNVRPDYEPIADELVKVTLRYATDDINGISFGLNVCCESIYGEGAPVPDPEDPIDCGLMSAEANIVGTNIELDVTGAPGTVNSVWTYTPAGGGSPVNIGSNISSAALIGYGQYSIIVTSGPCTKTTGVSHLDACTGFAVSITASGGVLTAVVPLSFDPVDSYAWSYSEDGIAAYTPLGTISTQVTTEGAGFYKVEVTKGDCGPLAAIKEVTEGEVCELLGEITKEGNVLTFVPDDEEVVITGYQWFADYGDGEGSVIILDGTLVSYTATQTGYYSIVVTLENGCEVTFNDMHNMCSDCASFGATLTEEAGLMTAVVEGCAEPEYKWLIDAGVTKDLLPITINTFTPEEDGIYFLVICCGTCAPVIFTFTKIGGTILISNSTIVGDYNWSM